MTDGVILRTDALRVVQGSGNGRGESLSAVVPARLRQPMPDTIEAMLGNVVPFLRPRGEAAARPRSCCRPMRRACRVPALRASAPA